MTTRPTFDDMGLHQAVLRGVYHHGCEQPSLAQAYVLPQLLASHARGSPPESSPESTHSPHAMTIVEVPSGMGKTMMMTITSAQTVMASEQEQPESADTAERFVAAPVVIHLCPAREVAIGTWAQTYSIAEFALDSIGQSRAQRYFGSAPSPSSTETKFSALSLSPDQRSNFKKLLCASIVGGVNVREQLQALRYNPPILVGTPGRLLDLIHRGVISLHKVRSIIIDDAPRMLDVGFEEQVAEILHGGTLARAARPLDVVLASWEEAQSVQRFAVKAHTRLINPRTRDGKGMLAPDAGGTDSDSPTDSVRVLSMVPQAKRMLSSHLQYAAIPRMNAFPVKVDHAVSCILGSLEGAAACDEPRATTALVVASTSRKAVFIADALNSALKKATRTRDGFSGLVKSLASLGPKTESQSTIESILAPETSTISVLSVPCDMLQWRQSTLDPRRFDVVILFDVDTSAQHHLTDVRNQLQVVDETTREMVLEKHLFFQAPVMTATPPVEVSPAPVPPTSVASLAEQREALLNAGPRVIVFVEDPSEGAITALESACGATFQETRKPRIHP